MANSLMDHCLQRTYRRKSQVATGTFRSLDSGAASALSTVLIKPTCAISQFLLSGIETFSF